MGWESWSGWGDVAVAGAVLGGVVAGCSVVVRGVLRGMWVVSRSWSEMR